MGKTDGGVKKKFTEALKSGSSIIACYEDLFDASRIALFGFDAASRRYGLVDTVESICAVDSEVSQNPIGEIYEKLEPNIDKRHKLIDEMSQISLDSCEYVFVIFILDVNAFIAVFLNYAGCIEYDAGHLAGNEPCSSVS